MGQLVGDDGFDLFTGEAGHGADGRRTTGLKCPMTAGVASTADCSTRTGRLTRTRSARPTTSCRMCSDTGAVAILRSRYVAINPPQRQSDKVSTPDSHAPPATATRA